MNIEQALQTTLEESTRYHTFEKLSEILDPEVIEQGFQQAGIATVRKRRLPLEAVLWSVIGMALFREEIDSGHGRIESRYYRQLRMSEWITEGNAWQGIQTLIEVTRKRIIKDKEQQETLYYISSLAPDIVQISDAIRGHWEVENKVHWVLDVTFKEDDCRIRKDDGAENVGIIRRFVLNLSRLHPSKISMRRKLKRAARVDEFRAEIIFG